MIKVFQSERLYFRQFTLADADILFELNNDPEVTKFTFDPISSLDQALKVLSEVIIPQYELYGYGRWAAHLSESDEFIGWCGLKYIPENNEIDLGYRFFKKYWNKGYATEAAKATISYGFNTLDLKTITGHAVNENISSISVLKKCNMQFLRQVEAHGHLTATYQIKNSIPSL